MASRSSFPDVEPGSPRESQLTAGLFAAVFVALLAGVQGSVGWFDGAHLTLAAAGLDIAHPTGFPAVLIAGHGASLLPLGPIPFRVALVSALATAGASTLLWRVLRRHDVPAWAALAGAAAYPAVFTVWLHATGQEVYAQTAFGVALLAWCLLRPEPRWTTAALVTGFGAGLHVSFAVSALALWPVALTATRSWRTVPRLLPLAAFGALVVAYLPLAAARDPFLNWGDPSTPGRLWQHLTAAGIRESFAAEMGASVDVPLQLGRWLGNAGGPLGALALVVALAGGSWVRPRRIWVALVAVTLADALFSALVNPMGQLDRQTGVVGAWALMGAAALSLGQLPAVVERRWPGRRVVATVVGAFVALVLLAATATEGAGERGPDPGAARYGRVAMTQVAPDASVFAASDHLAGLGLYLQGVEGVRRDVLWLVAQHLADTNGTARRFRHAGRPVPAVATDEDASQAEALGELVAALRSGPVYLELGSGADGWVASRTMPAGVFYRLSGAPSGRSAVPSTILAPLLAPDGDLGYRARHVLSDVDKHRGLWHLLRGDVTGAAVNLEVAVARDPDNARALLNLAAVRRRQGRLPEAIALLERAVALDPGYSKARDNLAAYRALLGP